MQVGPFLSGCGFAVYITPKYRIKGITWLTMGYLNYNRVSVDFLISHLPGRVADCVIGYWASASFSYVHGDRS